MFDPDVNLIIAGGAFVSVAFCSWMAHRSEKRVKTLEGRVSAHRHRDHTAKAERDRWMATAAALEDAHRRLNERI